MCEFRFAVCRDRVVQTAVVPQDVEGQGHCYSTDRRLLSVSDRTGYR